MGHILTGHIEIGMKIDLTILGLALKPVITDIGFALHRDEGAPWEDVGLTLSDIPEEDKVFIKSNSPFRTPVSIEAPLAAE